ncbi:hypothetical protein HYFRA_00003382 [Hymenoscyphus fraxineus]|uniref:tRNA-dihydrouridine(47) synthase [NAD(P)(+)] n=1 Tax=Hymenoscyphus fraxineus TaxID=746836 RepID=A0A9N9PT68_9HELO|nr:hypothetical protein HYFRA_00003382 [Hymenoscyphus fraxineus]
MAQEPETPNGTSPPLVAASDAPSLKRPAEAQNGTANGNQSSEVDSEAHAPKRARMEEPNQESKDEPTKELKDGAVEVDGRDRVRGIAPVKEEYLIDTYNRSATTTNLGPDGDDDAEAKSSRDSRDNGGKKGKAKGQNKDRKFGSWYDAIKLCNSVASSPEFSPKPCQFGEKCRASHNLREYLAKGKSEDLATFNGKCPVYEVNGRCHAGWKCRFAGSHSKEIEREDGRKELVLIEDENVPKQDDDDEVRKGVFNVVSTKDKLDLSKKRTKLEKSDAWLNWMEKDSRYMEKIYHSKKDESKEQKEENRAQFVEPPFLPSEKRRLYFGPETPLLAPLTTQGNLPFRRLCVGLGAQLTFSEMAMSLPLIQGLRPEWALMKAHESELSPPRYTPKSIVQGYDNSKDLKFGVQISANKPQGAIKTTEVLSKLVPNVRVIDLNCGCPIDLVYRSGAGSALLDAPTKMEKMIRGMNAVSGDIPITAKIRTGTMKDKPTAQKVIERLAFGNPETYSRIGAPGCAAITLHGRSRQQRYTKSADWSYIAECAALVKSYNDKKDSLTDTAREPDARTLPNSPGGKMYFMGNGDCYSHEQYYDGIEKGGVDSVMVARGALIKPWLFEEIEKGQYLDKSASERLGYVEQFVRFGLEAWGSDEVGVGTTRKFLLEWLSFACRYVPVGILEHLPPSLQDRPPAYRGRNDMETLLASDNYLDWVKISEMYLGKAHKDFRFQPKHKSNSYEIEAEG